MPLAAHRLEVRRSPTGLQWWRGHCGTCASCVSGLEAWCLSFQTPADELTDDPSAGWEMVARHQLRDLDPVACAAAAAVLDVVSSTDIATGPKDDRCVLVVGLPEHAELVCDALQLVGVAAVPEPVERPTRLSAEARTRLAATSSSGRADLIVSFDGALAPATRWVRRGGAIAACLWWSGSAGPAPALDTLTMREVTIAPLRRPHLQLAETS